MKFLIIIYVTISILSQSKATLSFSGGFIFSFFTDSFCNTITGSSILASTSSSCWNLNSESIEPTDWISSTYELALNLYSTTDCSGTSFEGAARCDGTCNTIVWLGFYFTCHYTNAPTIGHFKYTGFSEGTCTATNSPTITYSSNNVCWNTGLGTSLFPIDYNATSYLLSASESVSSSVCNNFACTNILFGTLTCDGNCQFDAASFNHYKCSYSNSEKLIANILVNFAIMIFFYK